MLTQAASFSLIMLPASFLPAGVIIFLMLLKKEITLTNIEHYKFKVKTTQIYGGMWKQVLVSSVQLREEKYDC
jgi:hypothetical protein